MRKRGEEKLRSIAIDLMSLSRRINGQQFEVLDEWEAVGVSDPILRDAVRLATGGDIRGQTGDGLLPSVEQVPPHPAQSLHLHLPHQPAFCDLPYT
jgi:hypothetical protein